MSNFMCDKNMPFLAQHGAILCLSNPLSNAVNTLTVCSTFLCWYYNFKKCSHGCYCTAALLEALLLVASVHQP